MDSVFTFHPDFFTPQFFPVSPVFWKRTTIEIFRDNIVFTAGYLYTLDLGRQNDDTIYRNDAHASSRFFC